jgi:hypothetical protein
MRKENLIEIIQQILKTDTDMGFLRTLGKSELETLVACIRERIDNRPE